MIAGPDHLDVRPHALDDPGTFMAEHRRQRNRIVLIPNDHVGVAQAGCDNAHQHFAPLRLANACRFDCKRRALGARHGGSDFGAANCLVHHDILHFKGGRPGLRP